MGKTDPRRAGNRPRLWADEPCELLLEGGLIAAVGHDLPAEGAQIINAAGLVAAPGLVDMHTHMREPGFEDKETIATGTAAAARGGVTSILAMANTCPVIDRPERVADFLQSRHAQRQGAGLHGGCGVAGHAGQGDY